jgi:hypothetical protein
MKDMQHASFTKRTLLYFAASSFVALLCVSHYAQAQTVSNPDFLITWKTSGSNIPSFYVGKALPTYGSQITASLELVSGGKILNLSGQTIYWYLNDTLIGGGSGVQQVTFPPFGAPPSVLDLRVVLPNYNGSYFEHSIQIPMVNAEVVMYAPYPNGQFSNNPLTLTAIPYFFDVTDATKLSYTWTVNGITGTSAENPQQAQITLPQGTTSGASVSVSVSAENNIDSTIAAASENLTYQSQL